ncbi:MAG: SBBP repeat-containing protein [Candidatus Cloacimonetes bacterium]|nr:SBBP repeat-containing protein [Candidatus Cloacimonadota bacterium]
MKRKLLILLFILFSFLLFAQAPEWQWVTQAGGTNTDVGRGITIDTAGNSYVTGLFRYTATFGSYSIICNGVNDIFIAKMDTSGNWLWASQAGGIDPDVGIGIAIDDFGCTYITGCFGDIANFGYFSLTSNGWADIFIAKMDTNGNWMWATQAGGTQQDFGLGITLDNAGNIYVTGSFTYPATFGSTTLVSNGIEDIFIAKLDVNGNWLWATQAGGTSDDSGYAITVDASGNSYVTGLFTGTATFGSFTLISSGDEDIFIAKMDVNGNWLWASQAGGDDNDRGEAITIDDAGNSYVTGSFYGTATFGSNTLISSGYYGESDIFVAKMDAYGNWQWATQAGGSYNDLGYGITINTAGNSYVTGSFKNTATFGSYTLISSGYIDSDIFVAKMDVNGNWLWAIQAGGDDNDRGEAITIDDNGNSYVTGKFKDTATFGSFSLIGNGWDDIFVAKLDNPVSAENHQIQITKYHLTNFPNPFNPAVAGAGCSSGTTISYDLPVSVENAVIEIFNIKGKIIRTFNCQNQIPVTWDGTDQYRNQVASGVYLYRIRTDDGVLISKKMLLLK